MSAARTLFDPEPKPAKRATVPILTCPVCRIRFRIYGEIPLGEFWTCGAQECIRLLALDTLKPLALTCACPQRPYPHEVSIHTKLRGEGRRNRWPWALALSSRLEPSTETEMSSK